MKFYLLSLSILLGVAPATLANETNEQIPVQLSDSINNNESGSRHDSNTRAAATLSITNLQSVQEEATSSLTRLDIPLTQDSLSANTKAREIAQKNTSAANQNDSFTLKFADLSENSMSSLQQNKQTCAEGDSLQISSNAYPYVSELREDSPHHPEENKQVCTEGDSLQISSNAYPYASELQDNSPSHLEEHEQVCAEVENFIRVTGCSGVLKEEIQAIIKRYTGRILTREVGLKLRDEITLEYISNGYITSRAEEPERLENGVIEIRVIEGSLKCIEVIDLRNVSKNNSSNSSKCKERNSDGSQLETYVSSRIWNAIDIKTPLNVNELEAQLRLLSNEPIFERIVPILQRTEDSEKNGNGESKLVIEVESKRNYSLDLIFNNYSPPSIDSERIEFNLSAEDFFFDEPNDSSKLSVYGYEFSLLGSIDLPNLSILTNLAENDPFDMFNSASLKATYRALVNPRGDTLLLRLESNHNEITEKPFDEFNFRAESQLFGFAYRRPLTRSLQEEFALSLEFIFQNGQTFIFNKLPFPFGIGPDEDGTSRTSVFSFGQDYIRRDRSGRWLLRSQLSWGTGLFDATTNSGSIPDGQFISWFGQIQRAQRLGSAHLLVAQLDVQFALDSLLPPQQFTIGGGQSLRGYRENARSGDNGFRFSIEDRITLLWKQGREEREREPKLQLIPFIDVGTVWNNPDNPNDLPEQNFLASAGLGLLWEPLPNLELRVDYGVPFVDLDDRSKNLQDNGLHFRIGHSFSF